MEITNLPITEKSTEELLFISELHFFEFDDDDLETINTELKNRGITEEQIEEYREKEYLKLELAEQKRLEDNKTISYSNYEKVIIFICAPLILLGKSNFDLSIPELKRENFKIKSKQRLKLLVSSVIFYIILINILGNYYPYLSDDKSNLEMEQIDISDWESNRKWLDDSELKVDTLD
jgi:hypothetical protein